MVSPSDPRRWATEGERSAIVEIWKKIVDVQQHFNDLELRIRNFALTALVALVGASGFVAKEGFGVELFGLTLPLASLVLLGGLPIVVAFWFMDRHWYHRLLYGAVRQASFIEERARLILPELALTKAIAAESPTKVLKWHLHSKGKIDAFYGLLAMTLVGAALVAPWIVSPASRQNSAKPVPQPAPTLSAPALPSAPQPPKSPDPAKTTPSKAP